jgi:hypothetical protein
VPAEARHAGPINGFKIITVIRRDVMAHQVPHASMIQAAVLTGYQQAAEPLLWDIHLLPLTVIMVIKYSTVNAVPMMLLNAPLILRAPYPSAWELLLQVP